jgi:hypothetical protein
MTQGQEDIMKNESVFAYISVSQQAGRDPLMAISSEMSAMLGPKNSI